jgi:hypothetical protein
MIPTLLRNTAQLTRDSGEHPISGILATPAALGLMVVRVATTSAGDIEPQGVRIIAPEYKLELADYTASKPFRRPYFLSRDVLSANDYAAWRDRNRRLLADEVAHELGEIAPVQVGTPVAARYAAGIQVEGSVHVHASLTGRLAGGTELTIVAGQWALRSAVANSALAGRIAGNIAPILASNSFRYIIEPLV